MSVFLQSSPCRRPFYGLDKRLSCGSIIRRTKQPTTTTTMMMKRNLVVTTDFFCHRNNTPFSSFRFRSANRMEQTKSTFMTSSRQRLLACYTHPRDPFFSNTSGSRPPLYSFRRSSSSACSSSSDSSSTPPDDHNNGDKIQDGALNHNDPDYTGKQHRVDMLDLLGVTKSQIRDEHRHISSSKATPAQKQRRRRRKGSSSTPGMPSLEGEETLFPMPNFRRYDHHGRRRRIYDSYYFGPYRDDEDGDDIIARLHVKSVHAAQTIDVMAVLSKVFSNPPPVRHMFGRTSVIVQLLPPSPPHHFSTKNNNNNNGRKSNRTTSSSTVDHKPLTATDPKQQPTEEIIVKEGSTSSTTIKNNMSNHPTSIQIQIQPRFVAIFRFGSVVFFNVTTKEAGRLLEEIKRHSIESVATGFERKEHFEIAISPDMEETAHVNGDFAKVKELDMNNVAVLSTIMAQTVALDSYGDTVDELLAKFASINSTVKRTGNFTVMEREALFKVVAQNNSIFIDMISKLGIKDRSDTAWNLSQYERVHEGMKGEFEIDSRFDQIEFKLTLIQQNAKFFLEILHNQKSTTLEWIIIVLISFECALMCMEMSGLGHSMFELVSFPNNPVVILPSETTTTS